MCEFVAFITSLWLPYPTATKSTRLDMFKTPVQTSRSKIKTFLRRDPDSARPRRSGADSRAASHQLRSLVDSFPRFRAVSKSTKHNSSSCISCKHFIFCEKQNTPVLLHCKHCRNILLSLFSADKVVWVFSEEKNHFHSPNVKYCCKRAATSLVEFLRGDATRLKVTSKISCALLQSKS